MWSESKGDNMRGGGVVGEKCDVTPLYTFLYIQTCYFPICLYVIYSYSYMDQSKFKFKFTKGY